jgi:hypothetical protein
MSSVAPIMAEHPPGQLSKPGEPQFGTVFLPVHCQEEKCAWWRAKSKRCSMVPASRDPIRKRAMEFFDLLTKMLKEGRTPFDLSDLPKVDPIKTLDPTEHPVAEPASPVPPGAGEVETPAERNQQ